MENSQKHSYGVACRIFDHTKDITTISEYLQLYPMGFILLQTTIIYKQRKKFTTSYTPLRPKCHFLLLVSFIMIGSEPFISLVYNNEMAISHI